MQQAFVLHTQNNATFVLRTQKSMPKSIFNKLPKRGKIKFVPAKVHFMYTSEMYSVLCMTSLLEVQRVLCQSTPML